MQLPNPPSTQIIKSIENVIQNERLSRYMGAAENNKDQAFKYYMWNCMLSEAFYMPLHFCEISCRNALSKILKTKLGNEWFKNETLFLILDKRYSDELKDAIKKEQKQHGQSITAHQVTSALSFGFWEHLVTKRFERLLWNEGVRKHFPNAPQIITREDLRERIEIIRRWRNRIAHYQAIFDKRPTLRHQQTIELIKWICPDTAAYVSSLSRVPFVMTLKPKEILE